MKKRLKDVIGSLYKPSAGVRQAFALPRADAEQLPRLPSVAVISITAPERPPAAVDGFEHLLRLIFAAVVQSKRENPCRFHPGSCPADPELH
ncbi:Hypothetical protein HEAR2210 [Herminiimonas arsenicoxydans]|uniref:Uncharacterized protein n=1 Tax=Herminiimonas arsenicoxydans TaxID=204773 RepID=A4G758_HERAR|nr:Hypothetical protein HEAR2210 [Herminiimonas arsenicoxydans]